jgi:hypothetical protein
MNVIVMIWSNRLTSLTPKDLAVYHEQRINISVADAGTMYDDALAELAKSILLSLSCLVD